MKLIVGLGNPGKEYEKSRHNAGFVFAERMAEGSKFSANKRFESEICEKGGVLIVKPQTFMNESGRAVRKMMDFYKFKPEDIILVHDDLDLELGEFKIQAGVGPKVHNGVNSVEQYLGMKNFLRVRLGIDNRKQAPTKLDGADYVLESFKKEEREVLRTAVDKAMTELLIALGL